MIKNLLITIIFCAAGLSISAQEFIYFESFNDAAVGELPEGYSTFNVDGNTIAPFFANAGVTFNNGWEVRAWQDLEAFSGVASSSSNYEPAGTADDWLITPDIDIDGVGALLVWQGLSVAGGGYEVYVSTEGNNLSDFAGLSPIMTVDDENDFLNGDVFMDRSFDLSDYDGETIWVAFRNNNTTAESNLILINDIGVLAPPSPIEAGVRSIPTVEYAWLAVDQSTPLQGVWAGTAENFGLNDISNVQVVLNVDTLDVDNNPTRIFSAQSEVVPTLAAGESIDVTIDGTFTPNELRLYKFSHEIIFDEDNSDSFDDNQESRASYMIITENFTSRAGPYLNPTTANGNIPIDPELTDFVLFFTSQFDGITGSVGQVIDIVQPASIDSIFLQFFEPEGDVFATLYEFNNDNVGDLIATTETRNFSGVVGGVLEGFAFDCPIPLEPGQYFMAYEDPEETTANFTFTNFYATPNRQFIRTAGGPWMPFNNAPIIYANFSIGDSAAPLTAVEVDSTPSSLEFEFDAEADGVACDYAWDFGDGNTGSGASTTHIYEEEGDFTVCVVVTNNSGEEVETCVDVSAACALELSEGTTTPSSIEVDVDNASGDLSYSWSDGQTTNPAVDLDASSELTVTVTDDSGCTADATFSTTSCSIGLTVSAISGSSALASVTGSNGELEFFWQNTVTGDTFTTTEAFVSDIAEGAWVVQVVDESGCSAMTVISLISGIGDPGILAEVQLAPNPTNGLINISLNSELSDELSIRLFDLQGKELLSRQYDADSSFNTTLDIENLAEGVYMIHFTTGENSFAKRVMLTK